YPTEVQDGEVWVDLRAGAGDRATRAFARLQDGLEQNLSLVTIKAVLALLEAGVPPEQILARGATFGGRYREAGWGPGPTILTAVGNVVDAVGPEDPAPALYPRPLHVPHGPR